MNSIENHEIVIIGAGAAGIGAALELLQSNRHDFVILEALDRIGGRFHTLAYGESYLEMGAQWMHGVDGNPVCDFAKANHLLEDVIQDLNIDDDLSFLGAPVLNFLLDKNNLTSDSETKTMFQTQSGDRIPRELVFKFSTIYNRIFDEIEDLKEEQISESTRLVDFVVERFNQILMDDEQFQNCSDLTRSYMDGLLVWRMKYDCGENGCSNLYDLSLKYYSTYVDTPGCQAVELKHGYTPIFEQMILSKSDGKFHSRLKLNHVVEQILICESISGMEIGVECKHCIYTSDPNKVCVIVSDVSNDCLTCIISEHVICTMSLGYLKHNYKTLISPSRHWGCDKINAIERLGYGTVNKIYLVYDKPFWPDDDFMGYEIVWVPDANRTSVGYLLDMLKNNSEKKRVNWHENIYAIETVRNHCNILCVWIYGCEYHEDLSDDEIKSGCSTILKQFLDKPDLPDPMQILRSRWGSDKFFRGSYSYIAVGSTANDITNLTKPISSLHNPLVLFAGEATSMTYSTLHGAYLSGIREAQRIIKLTK